MKKSYLVGLIIALLSTPVWALDVTYRGQGLIPDGSGGYDLSTELCGLENGADVDGPYLLWVLTATKADSATITGPWGSAEMIKFGNGTFKFTSGWYDPEDLPGEVVATYEGTTKNAQLVISHGCRPFETIGAWCSPGFWKNASGDAWYLTDYLRGDFFNDEIGGRFEFTYVEDGMMYPNTVAPLANDNPTFDEVLNKTANYFLSMEKGIAFNAVGAFLTDNIPGYHYDPEVVGQSNACPIDHSGNFKE